MKKTLAIVAVVAAFLTACSSSSTANLSATEFQTKIQDSSVVILDVRSPSEFMDGHIQGAINIDVEAMTFDSNIAALDKTKEYAVYCHSGRRSGIAIGKMEQQGFTKLSNLSNGISDWINQGLPVVIN